MIDFFKLAVDIARPLRMCDDDCGRPAAHDSDYCPDCRDNRAEAAYERSQGDCFRGGEAEAFRAEEQARIQRELK